MNVKKGIAILGSTGSIGTQALEVIGAYPDIFDLQVITAHSNADLLIEQAINHLPNAVVIGDETLYEKVKQSLWDYDITVYAGEAALSQVVEFNEIHTVLTALVGYAGLKPTLSAIRAKKTIALANKETLVWKEGMAEWGNIMEQNDLKSLFGLVPPPPPPTPK